MFGIITPVLLRRWYPRSCSFDYCDDYDYKPLRVESDYDCAIHRDFIHEFLRPEHKYHCLVGSPRKQKKWVHSLVLPYIRPKDIKINVNGDHLTINGVRDESGNGNSVKYEQIKTISIPSSVDRNNVKARICFGHILRIEAPLLKDEKENAKSNIDQDKIDSLEESKKELSKQVGNIVEDDEEIASQNNEDSLKSEIVQTPDVTFPDDTSSLLSGFETIGENEIQKDCPNKTFENKSFTDWETQSDYSNEAPEEEVTVTREIAAGNELKLSAIAVESIRDCQHDGVKFHEICMNTGAFDPADITLTCRDNQLIVKAINKKEKHDSSLYQEYRKIVYIPSEVNASEMTASMDGSGILKVSTPYKPVAITDREIPIAVTEEM